MPAPALRTPSLRFTALRRVAAAPRRQRRAEAGRYKIGSPKYQNVPMVRDDRMARSACSILNSVVAGFLQISSVRVMWENEFSRARRYQNIVWRFSDGRPVGPNHGAAPHGNAGQCGPPSPCHHAPRVTLPLRRAPRLAPPRHRKNGTAKTTNVRLRLAGEADLTRARQ